MRYLYKGDFMGMFDSVFIDCPDCGEPVEFQSKSGDNTLEKYTLDNCPLVVLFGIIDDVEVCEHCKNKVGLEIVKEPVIKVVGR